MNDKMRALILDIMAAQPDLTLATLRPDGWPQATTVSYANDGLVIYFGINRNSQKARNIDYSPRVSLTINNSYVDWNHIRGLSMAAFAEIPTRHDEIFQAMESITRRFPTAARWYGDEDLVFIKMLPKIISVLDYEQGFGHTDLIET
jgi:general stress protein 26